MTPVGSRRGKTPRKTLVFRGMSRVGSRNPGAQRGFTWKCWAGKQELLEKVGNGTGMGIPIQPMVTSLRGADPKS